MLVTVTDTVFVRPLDLNDAADRAVAGTAPLQNIYGVPWVIGAKKGFPNFNEFAMRSEMQVTRKLQVRKPSWDRPPNATNQLISVGILGEYIGRIYEEVRGRPKFIVERAEGFGGR